jgi:phage terminase large subunit-like protein
VGESLLARATRAAGGPEALLAKIGTRALDEALRTWIAVARPEQLAPPGDWDTWLIRAGRGFGKTRSGAEWVKEQIESGARGRIALIGPTASDIRDAMIEGESGIMSLYAGALMDDIPDYEPSLRRITWPNGAIATTYSAEEPDRLRNKQHDGGWCDELAAWDDPQACWDQYQFGLRLGDRPQTVVTTTPRPLPIIRTLSKDPKVAVTLGSTYDNKANLAPSFLRSIKRAYEGTRLGQQEIYAVILEDNPGALWRLANIEAARVRNAPIDFRRLAGAIDPAVTSREDSDESGIIFGGIADCVCKGGAPELHAFILEDVSGIYTPDQWARVVAERYHHYDCDRIIAEINNGGELVESVLRTLGDSQISFKGIHASRGKAIRAEPVAALYEQGKVHHVGTFAKLEDQLTQWNPLVDSYSPDRLDALVWLLTELLVSHSNYPSIFDVVS